MEDYLSMKLAPYDDLRNIPEASKSCSVLFFPWMQLWEFQLLHPFFHVP